MAVAPYLPKGASFTLWMFIYSLIFFLIAGWLALSPKKLVERIGKFLTPTLLFLLVFLFFQFLVTWTSLIYQILQEVYAAHPMVQGFLEGY